MASCVLAGRGLPRDAVGLGGVCGPSLARDVGASRTATAQVRNEARDYFDYGWRNGEMIGAASWPGFKWLAKGLHRTADFAREGLVGSF